MKSRFPVTICSILLCMSATFVSLASAAYPERTIRIVVPINAGTSPDQGARALAISMAEQLGTSVIVENVPGGNTSIGAGKVAKAAPDGYTLLLTSNQHAMMKVMMPSLPFDPLKAFAPITSLSRSDLTIAVRGDGPYASYEALIKAARAKPDELTYSAPGLGSPAHLGCASFLKLEGIQARLIPYKGSNEALLAVTSGLVDFSCPASSNTVPMVSGGKIRVLASTGTQRLEALPQVKTVAELTGKSFSIGAWTMMLAPQGTPPDVLARLNQVVIHAVAGPEYTRFLKNGGGIAAPRSLADTQKFLASEVSEAESATKAAGVTK